MAEHCAADRLLGTKGADGQRLDYMHFGTGDRHFVVDLRNPETGKFDEHKLVGSCARR